MAEAITSTVQRVSHMTLIINDQDAALDFYKKAIGAEVRMDQPFEWEGHQARWLTIGIPGDDLEWSLMPPMPSPNGEVPTAGNNNVTVLTVTDCDAATQTWEDAGGSVVEAPSDMPWGRSSVVRDPDGNPFNLVQPPA